MQPLLVVAAVLRDGGLLLACRRAPGKDAAGRWEFPGGKVEPGETPQAALEREIREELGVAIRVGGLIDRTVTARVDGRDIDLACYDCTLLDGRPTESTDHDELRWMAVDQLGAVEWADADLPAVRLLTASTVTQEEDA